MTRPLMTFISVLFVLASHAVEGHAGEFVVEPTTIRVMKSVYGQVQSKNILPARARIGGTIIEITVEEGDRVSAGDVIARIVDAKLALHLNALDSKIKSVSSQLDNALVNRKRAEELFTQGAVSKSRLDEARTQADVLSGDHEALLAERSVIVQQAREGAVVAPADGRVLSKPVSEGSVVLAGETMATIASGGYFLRLSLPERFAAGFREGDEVTVGQRGLVSAQLSPSRVSGRIVKVYPEIRDGRVLADVEVDGLGNYFVGERTLVSIPIGERQAIAIPPEFISSRHSLDFVTVILDQAQAEVSVIPGETFDTPAGQRTEILTGLNYGDTVVSP